MASGEGDWRELRGAWWEWPLIAAVYVGGYIYGFVGAWFKRSR